MKESEEYGCDDDCPVCKPHQDWVKAQKEELKRVPAALKIVKKLGHGGTTAKECALLLVIINRQGAEGRRMILDALCDSLNESAGADLIALATRGLHVGIHQA